MFRMYVVIQVKPQFVSFPSIYQTCAEDFRMRRLSMFDSRASAYAYLREQQRQQQQAYFLMLAFQRQMQQQLMREYFIQKRIHDFLAAIHQVHYYSPHQYAPRPMRFSRENSGYHFHRDDTDFAIAQSRSMDDQYAAMQTTSANVKSPAAIPFKSTLPADFKLADSVSDNLRNGKLYDLIAADDISLDGIKELACVRTKDTSGNVTYQLYQVEDLVKWMSSRAKNGTFPDMNTNTQVNIKEDVFKVSPDTLKTFVQKNQPPVIAPTIRQPRM